MSETAQALGLATAFEWEGRALTVAPLTLAIEGLYAYELERRTWEGIHRHASQPGHAEHVRQFNDDLAAGEFEFHGRIGRHARSTPTGTRLLAWLRLTTSATDRPLNRGFGREDLDRLFRDIPSWNRLVALMDRMDTPSKNGQPPAAAGASPSAPPI